MSVLISGTFVIYISCLQFCIVLYVLRAIVDEKPVALKKHRGNKAGEQQLLHCIVHYDYVKETKVAKLTEQSFKKIQLSVRDRQAQSKSTWRLDNMCGAVPTSFECSTHGRHLLCYKNFTNTKKFPKQNVKPQDTN